MKFHIPLWPLYYDPTSEDWEYYTGPPQFEALFLSWCATNRYDPSDDHLPEEVLAHHKNGKVYMIKMPTGEVIGEYEEEGLTAFQVEQARRQGDNADYFLQEVKRRQTNRQIGGVEFEKGTQRSQRQTTILP